MLSLPVGMGSSIASFFFGGGGQIGGGGQAPQMYRQKKIATYMRERAKRASASKTCIVSGLKIHLHTYNQCSSLLFLTIWHGAIYDGIMIKHYSLRKIYEYASELRKFLHFHILKLLFRSIFCWYLWYFVSEIFSGLKLHLHIIYNKCSFLLNITHGMALIYKRQYTDKTLTLWKSMNMRASGASELRIFCHFYIIKVLFLSIRMGIEEQPITNKHFKAYFKNAYAWYLSGAKYFYTIMCDIGKLKKYVCMIFLCPPPPPPPVATPLRNCEALNDNCWCFSIECMEH